MIVVGSTTTESTTGGRHPAGAGSGHPVAVIDNPAKIGISTHRFIGAPSTPNERPASADRTARSAGSLTC